MIQITAQMRVLVAVEPVDGRKGIDSLARLCQEKLAEDPFSGCVFVFRSRRGTAIRLLTYDGQGYWLAQKRLSKGKFSWWLPTVASAIGARAERNLWNSWHRRSLILALSSSLKPLAAARCASIGRRARDRTGRVCCVPGGMRSDDSDHRADACAGGD